MGSVNFIAKPYKAEDVLSKIRRALGEANREGGVRMYVVE